MNVLGTIEKLNEKLVFLPKLDIDIFFDICKPNEQHIKENSLYFLDLENISDLQENQIIYCKFIYLPLEFVNENWKYDVKIQILDKNGQKYLKE